MTGSALHTIGHSNHSIEDFIKLLQQHDIEILADVRSVPMSKRHPQFNKNNLAESLSGQSIQYVFLGKELGARRDEPDAYEGETVSYDRIAELPAFREGLNRLRDHINTGRTAIMCAEKEPLHCHRTLLVCRHLRDEFDIRHILAGGELESHADVEGRLIKNAGLDRDQPDLFSNNDEPVLERAYRHQG